MVEEPSDRSPSPDAEEALQPLDVDGVGTAIVGIVAWALALVGCLVFYDTLRDRGHEWWLWTCLAGLGLGLIGFEYCRRRRARLRRRYTSS